MASIASCLLFLALFDFSRSGYLKNNTRITINIVQIIVEIQAGPVNMLKVILPDIIVKSGINEINEDNPGPKAKPNALAATKAAQYLVKALK